MKAMNDPRDTGTRPASRRQDHPLEERYRRIQELAYRKAERRGFAPGREWQDWLEAEREVDACVRPTLLWPVSTGESSEPAPHETLEHRQGERVRVNFTVCLKKCDGQVYYGVVCNVGPDGMFVRTPAKLSKGCCFEICVEAPDGAAHWQSFSIPAFAVHEANGGLGLLFRPMDEVASAAVRGLRKGTHPLCADIVDRSAPARAWRHYGRA